MMERNIGIIGCGNMGSAIAQQLKAEHRIWAFDKDKNKTKNLSGIKVADSVTDLAKEVDTLVLAVKPQDFDTVLGEIKNHCNERLIVSIAAGIPTGYIENRLGKIRVIRVMPNLPAKVGKGMICLCKGGFATDADLDFVKGLFDYMGTTMIIKEEMMNAATAISGSGPGYLYDLIKDKPKEEIDRYAEETFIPRLSASAQAVKFRPEQALKLAKATTHGAIMLLEREKLSPEALRDQVASRGGTTEAGLRALHNTHSLEEAVKAALKRAGELSRK